MQGVPALATGAGTDDGSPGRQAPRQECKRIAGGMVALSRRIRAPCWRWRKARRKGSWSSATTSLSGPSGLPRRAASTTRRSCSSATASRRLSSTGTIVHETRWAGYPWSVVW